MDQQALARAKQYIDCADLSKVIDRLVYDEKWTRKEALAACQYYRNYLYLILKYSDNHEIPPSKEIDEVWHAHILHTEDYQLFCQTAFNYFVHHVPNHEDNKKLAQQIIEDTFEGQTQRLYYQEFGDYIYAIKPLPLKYYFKRLLRKLKAMLVFKIKPAEKGSNMDTSY